MALEGLLWCVATLLGTGVAAIAMARHRSATTLVYGVALCACVIALAIAGYLLGVGLLPNHSEAIEKGTLAPYFIVWGMIWIVEACAIVLAVTLLRTGVRGLSSR